MNILGISAFYHDSAAALVQDGRTTAAAQEERFTRKKHDYCFPSHAIEYCLQEARLTVSQLDYVVFYEKPLLKFDRLLETYLSFAPRGFSSFKEAIPLWLREKLRLQRTMDVELGNAYKNQYVFTQHHESHAASAFFPSPYQEAAIVTIDGVGEWSTATISQGKANRIRILRELHFPHSLGLLYSAFTYYTGFRVNSGEYKLMGLAPYGKPRFADLIKRELIKISSDGSFWMDMRYFNYCHGLTMTNSRFHRLFGVPPRRPESPIEQIHMDLAASIQAVTEEVMLKIVQHAYEITNSKRLCLAGGVALNCVGNGKVLREGPFEEIWVQPASGDAGGALGAALFVWHQLLDNPRETSNTDSQQGSFLGPAFTEENIREYLLETKAVFEYLGDEEELVSQVAGFIEDQMVVGWFQGRMEFGPRALGNRSILGDPRSSEMQKTMNLKIKFRESFRPFAPAVLREEVDNYFEVEPNFDSPYMLIVVDVKSVQREGDRDELEAALGFEKLSVRRSSLPAITHVDFSARIQTIDQTRHKRFHRLLKILGERSRCPIVVNTSFNVRGEPIVCTPEDAYKCFMATNMDVLVLGNFILRKSSQPEDNRISAPEHLAHFDLD